MGAGVKRAATLKNTYATWTGTIEVSKTVGTLRTPAERTGSSDRNQIDEDGLGEVTRDAVADEDRPCREEIGRDDQCQNDDRADPLCAKGVFAYLPVRDAHSQWDNGEGEQHVRQHRGFSRNESKHDREDPEEEERHDQKEDYRREEENFVDLDALEETA